MLLIKLFLSRQSMTIISKIFSSMVKVSFKKFLIAMEPPLPVRQAESINVFFFSGGLLFLPTLI